MAKSLVCFYKLENLGREIQNVDKYSLRHRIFLNTYLHKNKYRHTRVDHLKEILLDIKT